MNMLLVGCIFVSILFLNYFHIKGASVTSIIFFLALVYLFFFEKRKFCERSLGYPIRYFFLLTLPVAFFLILVDFSNFILVSKLLLMPLVILVTVTTLVDDENKLEKVKFLLIILLGVNALFALLQFFELDLAWKIRAMLHSLSSDNDFRVIATIKNHYHPIGLSYQSINFSYQMLFFFALTFSNLIDDKKNVSNRIYLDWQ
jgi:hypothetical protein